MKRQIQYPASAFRKAFGVHDCVEEPLKCCCGNENCDKSIPSYESVRVTLPMPTMIFHAHGFKEPKPGTMITLTLEWEDDS